MVVLGVPSGRIEPYRAHTGSRSFTPRVAAVITADLSEDDITTDKLPFYVLWVNIFSLGRKWMIGKGQKCAEPPGGGDLWGCTQHIN